MTTSFSDMVAFLDQLRAECVSVLPEGDKLHVWPATLLTPDRLAYVRDHKTEIIQLLHKRITDLLPSDEVCRAWRRRNANTGSRTP